MQPAIPDLETRIARLEAEVSRIMARVFPPPAPPAPLPPPPSAEELAQKAAFDAIVAAYGDHSLYATWALPAWRDLTPTEQAEALAHAPEFMRQWKETGRKFLLPLRTYLREKRWTYLDVKAQPAVSGNTAPENAISMGLALLFHEQEGGELCAYIGVDLAGTDPAGEGQQIIRLDDHLLSADARRKLRDELGHLGFPVIENGNHFIVGNLADALKIITQIPRERHDLGADGH